MSYRLARQQEIVFNESSLYINEFCGQSCGYISLKPGLVKTRFNFGWWSLFLRLVLTTVRTRLSKDQQVSVLFRVCCLILRCSVVLIRNWSICFVQGRYRLLVVKETNNWYLEPISIGITKSKNLSVKVENNQWWNVSKIHQRLFLRTILTYFILIKAKSDLLELPEKSNFSATFATWMLTWLENDNSENSHVTWMQHKGAPTNGEVISSV